MKKLTARRSFENNSPTLVCYVYIFTSENFKMLKTVGKKIREHLLHFDTITEFKMFWNWQMLHVEFPTMSLVGFCFSFMVRERFWFFSRMKSATQDRYWPDRLGSRTGGSGATSPNGLEKIWVAPSVWPMAISVWPIPIFRSVRSGQYPYFGLFGLANTLISVCSVWPIPLFRSVRSGQYPYFGLFGLANTLISVCLVWPIPLFRSVWSG